MEGVRRARARTAGAVGALLSLAACGGGTITSEDVTPGQAVVIGVVVIVAFLFIAYNGWKDR